MLLRDIVSLINLRVEKQKPTFGPTELDLEAGKLISHDNVKKSFQHRSEKFYSCGIFPPFWQILSTLPAQVWHIFGLVGGRNKGRLDV